MHVIAIHERDLQVKADGSFVSDTLNFFNVVLFPLSFSFSMPKASNMLHHLTIFDMDLSFLILSLPLFHLQNISKSSRPPSSNSSMS